VLPLLGAAAQLEQGRVEALDVTDGAVDAGGVAGLDERARLGRGGGERLLHQHVDAGAGQRAHGADVLLGRHRHDGELRRPGAQERVDAVEDPRLVLHDAEAIAGRIDRSGEVDAG
jgi:hypothetical protein